MFLGLLLGGLVSRHHSDLSHDGTHPLQKHDPRGSNTPLLKGLYLMPQIILVLGFLL